MSIEQSKSKLYKMKILYYFVIFNLVMEFGNLSNPFYQKRTLRVAKFLADCPNQAELSVKTINRNTLQNGSGFFFNFDFVYLRNIRSDELPVKVVFKAKRCESEEAPDTCIQLADFKSDKICQLGKAKNQAWTPFVECIQPNIFCHTSGLPKNFRQKGRDCTVNMDKFNMFPLGTSYWKFKLELHTHHNQPLYCSLIEGQMK